MNLMRLLCVVSMGMAPVLAGAQETGTTGRTTPAAAPVQEIEYVQPVMDNRWSLWPQIGAIVSDQSDLDSGIAGGLKATRPLGNHITLELGGDFSVLETTRAGDYERASFRAGLLLFPGTPFYEQSSDFQPFLGGGFHFSSVDFLGESVGAYGPYGTLGFLQRLGGLTMLSVEGRYQVDSISEDGVLPDSDYYTWQILAGLRIALGERPYDPTLDADRDGVPDARDRCPNTPPGVQVDADGCPLDGDGDGVPDYLDRCPGTPPGAIVGPDGCEIDTDGDGVPDRLDKCPNTPPGVQVGNDGCPLSDKDGDGILDHLDNCPDTPPGIPVGPDGCPLDSDGDGIPDHLDECPNTPPGAKVLPNGCALQGDCRRPRPGEQVDENGCALDRNFILRGVKFEFDSDRLTPEAKLILNEVAETLQAYPNLDVELEGHTDAIGTDAYNLGLSERRANSVKTYLTGRGVTGRRMTPVGYGESRPIDTNETDAGRENNRRVELKVVE
ncbi:MAG: OmpA family protein [Sinimarinibacterium flocculans]|uniref:OmpA family protein n=1 Tax=Sinimarinibacterium flocculans TaxID=985250 RepID=UPI002491C34C|nr:OmpA family protein [Sinimarinibacterium flocculans]MEC9362463.1 OmpA family protein [Pseudomonadota bacterium]